MSRKDIEHEFIVINRRIKFSKPSGNSQDWPPAKDVDMDQVRVHFLLWLMDDPVDGLKQFVTGDGLESVNRVIGLYKRLAVGETIRDMEWIATQNEAENIAIKEAYKRPVMYVASKQELTCLCAWDASEGLHMVFNCLDKAWNAHGLNAEYAIKQGEELKRLCEKFEIK